MWSLSGPRSILAAKPILVNKCGETREVRYGGVWGEVAAQTQIWQDTEDMGGRGHRKIWGDMV